MCLVINYCDGPSLELDNVQFQFLKHAQKGLLTSIKAAVLNQSNNTTVFFSHKLR